MELMGKEMTPEEVPAEVAALEELPMVHTPPCLEELVWAGLQEIHKLCESLEWCRHFEYCWRRCGNWLPLREGRWPWHRDVLQWGNPVCRIRGGKGQGR